MIETLCKGLRECRNHYGFTQQQLADRLRITQSTYAGYETGKSTPGIETIWKLADIYQSPIDVLIGRK